MSDSGPGEGPDDPAAVEARRREAALRALAAETGAGGTGEDATGDATEDARGGSRAALLVVVAVTVVLVAVGAVLVLGAGDDDGETATTDEPGGSPSAPPSTDEPSPAHSGTTLPAPVGDPPPAIEPTFDLAVLTAQFLAYRQWALANPGDVDPAVVAEPGSPAFQRLVDETNLLVGGERAVVLGEPRFDVVTVDQVGGTATFTGTVRWLRYSGFDTATGEVVEERAAGSSDVTGQLVQGPTGWKLTQLTIT